MAVSPASSIPPKVFLDMTPTLWPKVGVTAETTAFEASVLATVAAIAILGAEVDSTVPETASLIRKTLRGPPTVVPSDFM
jgi:hypothetical protein